MGQKKRQLGYLLKRQLKQLLRAPTIRLLWGLFLQQQRQHKPTTCGAINPLGRLD
jgi:hypothetical protein